MSSFLGVGLALVGTFCSATGYTLQKIAHNRAAADLEKIEQASKEPEGKAGPVTASTSTDATATTTTTTDADADAKQDPASSSSPAAPPAPPAAAAVATPSDGPNPTPGGGDSASAAPAAPSAPSASTPDHATTPSGIAVRDAPATKADTPRDAAPASKASATSQPTTTATATTTDSPPKKRSYWRYWQFPAGLTMLIVGAVFAVFVFGLAGQSELAPMGAVTMIFNTIMAWKFLGEPFTRIDLIATSLMAIGTTVSIAFGKSSDEEYNLDQLIDLLDRRIVWVTFGIEATMIVSCLLFVHTIGQRRVRHMRTWQIALDNFSRPFIGGMLAGFTGFLTKSSVEVAFNAVSEGDGSDWERWELYAFLVALGCCLFFQLKYMNSGLGKYDSMAVIPIYQSVLVLANATSGLIYFDELDVQTDTSVALFIVGCVVVSIGIVILLFKSRYSTSPRNASASSPGSPSVVVVGDGDGQGEAGAAGVGPDGTDSPAHSSDGNDAQTEPGLIQLSAMMAGNADAVAEAADAGDDAEAAAYVGRRRTHSFSWSRGSVGTPPHSPRAAPSPAPPVLPPAIDANLSPGPDQSNPLDVV